MTAASHALSAFAGFPGGVLQLSAAGIVLRSNGILENELSRPLLGTDFALAVDDASSREKWGRLFARVLADRTGQSAELILASGGELRDPRPFSLLRDEDLETLWLIEHPRDARLDLLRNEVTGINSELATTQRELVKEQNRLRQALAEQARLAELLRERNVEIAARNEALLETTRELERSNRALDEFAHAVSHDLKAPLRAIANYSTWVREDLGANSPAVQEQLGQVVEQVGRMRALIDGAIDYARAGRAATAGETIDLGGLAREIVALLDPRPPARVTVADDMPVIHASRAPLQQVLQNLIDNAVKHAVGRPVHVTVDAVDAVDADGFVELRVADDGPGIPAHLQERVWGLFQTLHPSSDRAAGTGIGLALVRRLAEAHGGRAWVDSEEGRGARFHVLWPKHSRELPHAD